MKKKHQEKVVKVFALIIVLIMLFQVLMPLFNSLTINSNATTANVTTLDSTTINSISTESSLESSEQILQSTIK